LEEAVALFSPASASSSSDPNPLEDDDDDGTGPPLLLLSDQLRSRDFSRSLPSRQRGRASAGSLASFLSEAPAPAASAAAAAAGSGTAAGGRAAVEGQGAAGKEPPAEETGAGPGADPPGTLFDRPGGGLHRGSTEESGSSSDGGGLDEAAPREACLLGAAQSESRLLGGYSGEDPLNLLPPPPPPALRRSVGILLPAGLVLRRHASCGGRLETSAGQGEEEGEEEGRMARASMVANLPSRRFSLAPANPLYRAPHGLQAAPARAAGSEHRLLPRPRRRRWTLLAWLPGRRHPPPAPPTGAAA
jgi:hypothetical protein